MKRALIVFAKKPEVGKVKTRLVPPLSYEEAKELYLCFTKDALHQYMQLSQELEFKIFLTVTPERTSGYFEDIIQTIRVERKVGAEIAILYQAGQDLGERMFNAFTSVFSEKYDEVVVIGTDHPTLPDDHIRQSFASLGRKAMDAVIGPAEDGGYYLLGLKRVHSDFFNEISWSSNKVFDQTIRKFHEKQLSIHLLPTWYDVDDKHSLARVIKDFSQNKNERLPFYSRQYLHMLKDLEVS